MPEVPRLLRAGRPHRASCQPAAVLAAADGHLCSGLSAQRAAAPGLGELRSSGALKPLPAPWDAPARPGPTAPFLSAPPAEPGRGGQSPLLAPFPVSPSLRFLGKKELIMHFNYGSCNMLGA